MSSHTHLPFIQENSYFSRQHDIDAGQYRSEDLNMGAVFNARERTFSEWKTMFTEADSRFTLKSVKKPKGSTLSLMEVGWTP